MLDTMRHAGRFGMLAALVLAAAGPGCSGATGRIGGAGSGGTDGGSSADGAGSCIDPASSCAGKCGQWVDACGTLVTCGGCGGGQNCGGGGAPNVCGTGLCVPACAGKGCGASNGCDAPCTTGCDDAGNASSSGGGSSSGGASSSGSSSGSASSSGGPPPDAGFTDSGHKDAGGSTCSPYGTYGCQSGGAAACCAGLGCDPYLDVCYVAEGAACNAAESHCVGVENVTCLPSGVCGATTSCQTAGADCSKAACCTNYPCTPFSDGSFTCETAGQCVPSGASCEIAPCCPGAGACNKGADGAFCGP